MLSLQHRDELALNVLSRTNLMAEITDNETAYQTLQRLCHNHRIQKHRIYQELQACGDNDGESANFVNNLCTLPNQEEPCTESSLAGSHSK